MSVTSFNPMQINIKLSDWTRQVYPLPKLETRRTNLMIDLIYQRHEQLRSKSQEAQDKHGFLAMSITCNRKNWEQKICMMHRKEQDKRF